jgi:ADP-ribose pyrophosphatase YjhB (NUDIX family)
MSSKKMDPYKWLKIAQEIQAIGQTGLTYSEDQYNIDRYNRLIEMAAEIAEEHTFLNAAAYKTDFLEQAGYATPKVDVRGAIFQNDRILLVQERSDERWCMPGGWADVGETPSEMVVREVFEESGLEVRATKLIGVWDANRGGRPLVFYHAYKLVFACEIIGGSPRVSDETLAVDFFNFDQLPPLSEQRTNENHLEEVRQHWHDSSRPGYFE